MTNNGVDQKPSETALFAALRRSLAHKQYQNDPFGPDFLADLFLPSHFRLFLRFKRIRTNTLTKLDEALPGLNEYMIARTAFFDRHFVAALQDHIPQIVLLGAGYDSRAFRFADYIKDTQIFELDAAPTQNRKLTCLKKAGVAIPPHVHFVPINFNKDSLENVLDNAGYSHQSKTLFIWEGVTYYLDLSSVEEMLTFFNNFSHAESSLAFDYITSISEESIANGYGVKEFSQTMQEHHGNEALVFSIADGDIESFLGQRNLTMVEHLDNEEIENAFLLDDNGNLLGNITGHFRLVLASKMQTC